MLHCAVALTVISTKGGTTMQYILRFTALAMLAMSVAGCSSAKEKLCRTDIEQTLLNPETAQYSEFRPLTAQDLKDNELWSGMSDIMKSIIPKDGASYATMKVRAEGKLGNVITSRQFCAINAANDQCSCISSN